MASRKIEDLTLEMQNLYREFAVLTAEAGIDFIITCTYRTQEEQDRLYRQGRTAPGKIVTWTRHSKHNERKAFDIAIMNAGKINWDEKAYQKTGEIGESLGLIWGGRWKSPDYPHFQFKEGV